MEQYFLNIVEDEKINPIFIRANSALIKKHKDKIQSLRNDHERSIFLEDCWKTEYKAEIEKRNLFSKLYTESWLKIKFLNKAHYTLFMLRWG